MLYMRIFLISEAFVQSKSVAERAVQRFEILNHLSATISIAVLLKFASVAEEAASDN